MSKNIEMTVEEDKKPAELQDRLQASDEDEDKGEDAEEASTTTIHHPRHRYKRKPKFFYFIGGSNGGHWIDNYLSSLGWERIHDRNREDYRLKWCEIKSHNNYHCFREGEQLVYQIPNNKLLTTKIGLLTSLQEYDRVMNKVKKGKPRIMRYQDFLPETYRLDIKDDREQFFELYKDGEVWISKPTGLNQGKGIYLIRSSDDITKIQEKLAETEDDIQSSRKLAFRAPMARIVQRYVMNPLLLEGRKFDVRNYMLIACTNPLVVFYRDGYCRLTCMPYDPNSTDLTGHLTNQFMQKKNPLYEEIKDDTVWSMDRFNDYVNEHFQEKKNLPEDWVHTVLRKRCQQILLQCFQAVRHKLECRLGFFDLYGCDFLVDDDFKISLLEMNCNPALHTNCETLRDIVPGIVEETLKLSMEIFDKALKRERIMPLASQDTFIPIYNGDVIEAAERRERLQSAAEARRRARSAQRRKRFVPGQYVYRRSMPSNNNNSNNNTNNNNNGTNNGPSATNTTTTSNTSTQVQNNNSNTNNNNNSSSSTTPISPFTAPSNPTNTVSPYRGSLLPSSTVTAGTSASQMRVVQSKSTPNVSLKPFYAGGSVSSRPYSAPKFNRKYSQVEPKIDTHNTALESPRKSKANNSSNNYAQRARHVLLAPKRCEVMTEEEDSRQEEIDEELLQEVGEELDALDREKLFEQILEEADEASEDDEEIGDDEEEEEELLAIGGCDSPDTIRRPSAKLPSSYHSGGLDASVVTTNGSSTWPRYPKPKNSISVHRKVSRIASLSVKGNFGLEVPLPSVGAPHPSPRLVNEATQKSPFRNPANMRLRQSLQATTCTLEIGPKSRRGLVAVSAAGKGHLHLDKGNDRNRRNNTLTKLKLINAQGQDQDDANIPSTLLYLAAAHLQNQQNGLIASELDNTGSLVVGSGPTTGKDHIPNQKNSLPWKNRPVADSSTQTLARSRAPHSGEEKVIWRLRSRASEGGKTDGNVSPTSPTGWRPQKVALKVPVVTQSPGLISPRKLVEFSSPRGGAVHRKSTNYTPASYKSSSRDSKDSPRDSDDQSEPVTAANKSTALSKVVAVATAAPTRPRPAQGPEGKPPAMPPGDMDEEVTLLAPG